MIGRCNTTYNSITRIRAPKAISWLRMVRKKVPSQESRPSAASPQRMETRSETVDQAIIGHPSLPSSATSDSCNRRSPCCTNCNMASGVSPSRMRWKIESASTSGRVRSRSYTCWAACSADVSPCKESNFLFRAWTCVSLGSASNRHSELRRTQAIQFGREPSHWRNIRVSGRAGIARSQRLVKMMKQQGNEYLKHLGLVLPAWFAGCGLSFSLELEEPLR